MQQLTRRQALRTMFCASAALTLNLQSRSLSAADFSSCDQHMLLLGDFGSGNTKQREVAVAMQEYVKKNQLATSGMMLLGDNFYSKMEGGVRSPRWKTGFEDMYPSSVFPGPAWVVLGNHDYGDNAGGDRVQLEYGKLNPWSRWTLPSKWYRFDFPAHNPIVTFLCLDSNLPSRSISTSTSAVLKPAKAPTTLSKEEEAAQLAWLKCELVRPRARFTVVAAHHPLYSNGAHGDGKTLINQWGGLLQQYGVHAYLCGHDHDLQHLEIKGLNTSFVLSGGGGAKIRDVSTKRQAAFAKTVHGFTHLQINCERLLFRHIDPAGNQLHAFTKKVDGSISVLS